MFPIDEANSRGARQREPSSQGGISVKSMRRKAVTANQETQSFLEWVTTILSFMFNQMAAKHVY